MQNLIEEQIQEKDEIFYAILEDFIDENYEVDDDYQMTEDDQAMIESLKEYFDSNFKLPSLQESALEYITGMDINNDLYEEFAYILLDESIGTAVAGAKYAISQALASYRKSSAAKNWQKTKDKHIKLASKNVQSPKASTSEPGKVMNPAKAAFHAQKAERIQKRVVAAKTARDKALSQKRSTEAKYGNITGHKAELAKNIDTKISKTKENIINRAGELKNKTISTASSLKNKLKSAVTKSAEKVGSVAGDIAGRLA